jgi:SNF family Na+-dependent transporter
MQTLGAFMSAITIGWCVNRSAALRAMAAEGGPAVPVWLYYWIRFGIPAAILSVGVWWLMTSVFGTIAGV